ncbi:MAG: hypothetical protein ACR2PH_08270 [Desulfobulbia bacterium]
MKQLMAVYLTLVFLSGDPTYGAQCATDLDTTPSWETETLIERLNTFFSPNKLMELHVLSWNTQIDNRPLKIDNLLLWTKWRTESGEQEWAIVSAFRWPENWYYRKWSLPTISHSAYQPFAEFNHKPTETDVLRFFNEHKKYHNDSPTNFKLIDGGIRHNTWQCLFGTAPSEKFIIENIYESY